MTAYLKRISLLCLFGVLPMRCLLAADWPEWRGPNRDGISLERGLPSKWSPAGDSLAWKAPFGGRSAPVVLGDHVYLQNSAGAGATLQERVICFHADTGKLLWEHPFNVYLSDVPPHRVGWASPAADPETGQVYVFGVGGTLMGLTRDGKVLWERSLSEEFGLVTTHGGRTVSPVVEGNLVIVSGISSGWGNQARGSHRFMAFDKRTGETIWVSSPGGRPFDTTYSPPIVAEVGGLRLFIAGGSDGTIHALKPQTGEPVWKYEISKRGINTGVVLKGNVAFVSHSEENWDTNDMGLLAAVDAGSKGTLGKEQVKWALKGFQGGFSSPVVDGDRIYQIDNGSNLFAFDVNTGKSLWMQNLGTIQKSSPVLADGKLYAGTENGKFFILKPEATGCQILDEDWLGTETEPEAIIGSPAVANGRIYLVSSEALYCIGKKGTSKASTRKAPPAKSRPASSSSAAPAHLQVVPTELVLQPGESVQFHARLFDDRGQLIKETEASWSLEQLQGDLSAGKFTASSKPVGQAGQVKATLGGLSGVARLRVIPPLPWGETFDEMKVGSAPGYWINCAGKFVVREENGKKVLVKLADNPFTKRARAYLGLPHWSNYTVEADVLATERRRQMGDAGVVAQRYALVLFGNSQKLELQPWQPETARTVSKPFSWKAGTWYRMKLKVEPSADGHVLARGKVWLTTEAEPEGWMIERVDPIPNRQGSPGLYADAPFEVFFDNVRVHPN
ncbi:MAG: PQQ-binding-like beta-propeller repeat protein [Acidobacteriota bacterium]